MKMTLGQLVNAEPALGRLAAQKLPAKDAYRVAKMLQQVPLDTKVFHEQREALIKELGEERDPTPEESAQGMQGKVVAVKPEHVGAFLAQLRDLEAVTVDREFTALSVATLGDITPADLLALGSLVTE